MSSVRISELLGDNPAPIQSQLMACREFEVGMITGFAAGKTRGIIAKAIQHMARYPGSKVLLGRKTYPEMINTVKQPFFAMADVLQRRGWFVRPANWDYREGTHLVRATNGSQCFFTNYDDPIKFRNEEYSLIIVDQAEELLEDLWDTLTGRCRWRGPDMKSVPSEAWQCIAAANDNGHNWLWRRFVDFPQRHAVHPRRCTRDPFCVFLELHPDEDGEPRPYLPCSTRRFFHGTTLDNRHNLSPRYLATLLAHPKEWQRHFIYATMEGGSGRLLPDPRTIDHVEPPLSWPRYRAVDHALNSPCCCLWITVNVDGAEYRGVPANAPYVYREYWAEHSSVDQHSFRIKQLTNRESIVFTAVDPSVYQRTQSGQEGVRRSIADLYADEGLFLTPSSRDPFARVERINIAHNQGLVVSKRCEHLIRSMPEYYAEQSKTDGTFRILNKSEFHAVDALGYGLMLIELGSMIPDFEALPDYLRKPSADPLERAHHKAEWKRMKRAQEASQQRDSGVGGSPFDSVPTEEFLGETAFSRQTGDYDPWGSA